MQVKKLMIYHLRRSTWSRSDIRVKHHSIIDGSMVDNAACQVKSIVHIVGTLVTMIKTVKLHLV